MEARRKRSEEPAAKTPSSQEQIAYFRSLVSGQHPRQTKSIQLKAETHGFALVPMAGVSLLNAQLNLPALWSPEKKASPGLLCLEVPTLTLSPRRGGKIASARLLLSFFLCFLLSLLFWGV